MVLINVGTFRYKCYQSLDVVYPVLKGIYNISRLITYNIRQSMLKLPTLSGFHDLFLNYSTWIISSPAAVELLYHVMQLTWFL